MDKKAEEYLEPVSENNPNRPLLGYEYLDHTADVQLHAWGPTLKEAFEQSAKAMFGYITELDTVSECKSETITVQGHDMESALYNFLDEWLFTFNADPFFVPFKIEITKFTRNRKETQIQNQTELEDNEDNIEIEAIGFGETFDLQKHPQGTEVKAITYSAMQIYEKSNFSEVFVIIDI